VLSYFVWAAGLGLRRFFRFWIADRARLSSNWAPNSKNP
jgi:hypothetical protein